LPWFTGHRVAAASSIESAAQFSFAPERAYLVGMNHAGSATLKQLIAASCGAAAATAFAKFRMSDKQRQAVADIGLEILRRHPPIAGACALMGAVYAQALRKRFDGAVHLVAGRLDVDGTRVFGSTGSIDGPLPFLKSDLDWDGHMWVAIGDYIADISLFRTGRSADGHPALKRMMAREFGNGNTALLVVASADAALSGLEYTPEYVLTQEEIDGLERGAMAILPVA
jgi:hypothetical protein